MMSNAKMNFGVEESIAQSTLQFEHIQLCDENDSSRANSTLLQTDDGDTKENKDLLDNGTLCFLCREKNSPQADCKVCQNIRSYQNENNNNNSNDDTIDDQNVTFPGPGIVKRNHIYGNYVVASRTIEEGEVIILERPITIGPYSPPDILPLCLSCCKDIGVSSKCSQCKWPVCGMECEQAPIHSENECKLFAKNNVRCKQELSEYFSVETLRALLLRDRNCQAWKRILKFESHSESRKNDYRAKLVTDFIINFIRVKCNLADQFSPEIIDHVVGVLSVNTFWAFKDLNRYASCLLDKITLFAHDCDPNTNRSLIFLAKEVNENNKNSTVQVTNQNHVMDIALRITASTRIEEGEMITIRYIDVNQPLLKRREELKETFYFECTCGRCLRELHQLEASELQSSEAESE